MKRIILIGILLLLFSVPVCAEENTDGAQLQLPDMQEIEELLPTDAADILNEMGIDINDPDMGKKLTVSGIFSHILEFAKTGGKAPAKTGICVLGIIILTAALSCIKGESGISSATQLVCTAAVAGAVLVPLYSLIESTASAIKGAGVFMNGFVPVFAGIVTLSGKVTTSTLSSATLLAAAQGLSYFAAFGVVPLMCAYLALSCCCAVSPLMAATGLHESVKKLAMWILSLIITLFTGVMSIQTMLSGASDTMAMRTGKFLIGSLIPLGGPALSEAASTLVGSADVLKSTVGIYAVIAVCACVLPLVIQLLLYRLWLFVADIAAGLFSGGSIKAVVKAADSVLSVLISLVLFTASLFIICVLIVVKAGGKG